VRPAARGRRPCPACHARTATHGPLFRSSLVKTGRYSISSSGTSKEGRRHDPLMTVSASLSRGTCSTSPRFFAAQSRSRPRQPDPSEGRRAERRPRRRCAQWHLRQLWGAERDPALAVSTTTNIVNRCATSSRELQTRGSMAASKNVPPKRTSMTWSLSRTACIERPRCGVSISLEEGSRMIRVIPGKRRGEPRGSAVGTEARAGLH